MNLPLYMPTEKQTVFCGRYLKINSIEEFERWVENHNQLLAQNHNNHLDGIERMKALCGVDTSYMPEPFLVYRGLNDASYKNFTSAQRRLYWNNYSEKQFVHLINDEILALKANSSYQQYLSQHQLGFDEWHALSFLQHYEGDTPCLDFTKDFFMALFFATDKASAPNDNPLSYYISFFYMTYPWEYDIYGVYGNATQNADRGIADYHGPYQIDYSDARKQLTTMPFVDFFPVLKDKDYPYMVVDNDTWLMDAPNMKINEQHSIRNNNIVNQNGCFAINFSINKPYEHGKLYCVDIHKDLIPNIESILKSKNIDRSTVYTNDGNKAIVCSIRDAVNGAIMGTSSSVTP